MSLALMLVILVKWGVVQEEVIEVIQNSLVNVPTLISKYISLNWVEKILFWMKIYHYMYIQKLTINDFFYLIEENVFLKLLPIN